MINKKTIVPILMLFLIVGIVNAGEFGNKHINPNHWGSLGSPLISGNKVCQENNMPKDGTVAYWCPAFSGNGNDEMIFWISETYNGGSGSAYQGSSRTIGSMNQVLWRDGCIDMPDVTVTEGQSLWFCAYNNGGGSSSYYRYYYGTGYDIFDDTFGLPSKTYPRYQNSVDDGRWYYNNVAVNGTPYLSGFLYDDLTGVAFPERDQYGQPQKVIQAEYQEFYFPYENEPIYNMSMIFKGDTEYWQMRIMNVTDSVDEYLYTCNATGSFNDYNITDYNRWSCNVSNVNLTRGYYRIYLACYQDASLSTYCDNSPTFIYHFVNDGWADERRPNVGRIDLFDYPRGTTKSNGNADDWYFTLGIDNEFTRTECYDGYDNDQDGTYDYPNDPDCDSWSDDSESGEDNGLEDESCIYSWDCNDDHNCYPNTDLLFQYLSYDCGCSNSKCTNIDTLYYPDTVTTVSGSPSYMRQFSSGNFAGMGAILYNFSSGSQEFETLYAEFDKDSLIRNNPSYPDRDALNWDCLIDFTDSYSKSANWIYEISGSKTLVSWENRSSSGDSAYQDLALISEGCIIDWIKTDNTDEYISGAEVGSYIYSFDSGDRSEIHRFSTVDGTNATPLNLDLNITALDSFSSGFVVTEYGTCTDSKKISYRDSNGNELWSYSDTFRTYEDIIGTDNGVYAVWDECGGGVTNRHVTKIAPNGSLVWEIQSNIEVNTAYDYYVGELGEDMIFIAPDFNFPDSESSIISKEDGIELIKFTGESGVNGFKYFIYLEDDEIESYENDTLKESGLDDAILSGEENHIHIFKLFSGVTAEEELPPDELGNCTTTCTTWSNPYILKEDFNGLINICNWAVTENVCYSGKLTRDTADDYYTIYKNTDLISDTISRYVTISFDLKPTEIQANGKVSISIFDSDDYSFLRFFVGELGKYYNFADGNMELIFGNTSTSETITTQIHIDLTNDDYDVWYDGSVVSSSNSFYDDFVNIENINAIRISSQNAEYELSNLEIFTSDQNNDPIILDIDSPITPIDEDTKFCGLFYKETPECTEDSDCETDYCLPNGRCNSFDMTYCDENQHQRGNYCVIAGLTSCTLESSANLILDNFLLFLVFLVLLVVTVYIIYAFK